MLKKNVDSAHVARRVTHQLVRGRTEEGKNRREELWYRED